jgi:hypothetical protein
MSKVKLILASILLVFAASAIAAASASAQAEFRLEGAESAEFAETVEVTSPLLLEAKGETEKEPTIECTKMKIDDGIIKNDSPEVTIKSLHFEGCADLSEKTCKVPTIATAELQDLLQEDGEKAGEKETDEKFKPKSGEEIAHFKLEGSECKESAKTLKIEGDFISKKEDNDKSEDIHNLGIEVTPGSGELKYGDQTLPALLRIDYHWRPRLRLNWYLF